jgi:hypothetical protein
VGNHILLTWRSQPEQLIEQFGCAASEALVVETLFIHETGLDTRLRLAVVTTGSVRTLPQAWH